ncbi:hypothetical protein [uncultured Cohaesibacter sp.]|uniref:hypothetical protein n=1 Tax=uncultured Cohaesibacter sp. TaxID=1002546 RepID=UPI002A0A6077|nr:hypothetical protein [uncultured Cohaesibacter sp.]
MKATVLLLVVALRFITSDERNVTLGPALGIWRNDESCRSSVVMNFEMTPDRP